MLKLNSFSFTCRAATANTSWTRTGRRPTLSSTTISVIPPTIIPGGDNKRASLALRRTATPSPTLWRSRSRDLNLLRCPRYRLCYPTAIPPRNPRVTAPCSGPREAGLPPHHCCPLITTTSTPCTGRLAAWEPPPRSHPQDSHRLFDTRLSFQ